MALLEVQSLEVFLGPPRHETRVLRDVSFMVEAGQTLGIVGESGCGKSMTALAIAGLLPQPGRLAGTIRFRGIDLTRAEPDTWRHQRGRHVAMIFQEPMTALNPVLTVGFQLGEMLQLHEGRSPEAARRGAVELLERVGIAEPERRARAYPHEMSGGMRQRVVIAMAMACKPELLIADEPTTALDVSVQAQILDLMLELQRDHGTALIFISHNFGVISEMADQVLVMYAGKVVEQGEAAAVLADPRHPYTAGLMGTIPELGRRVEALPVIPGTVPDLKRLGSGCSFQPRCARADTACLRGEPVLQAPAVGLQAMAAPGLDVDPHRSTRRVACFHA